ncbi:MAG: aminotransferase class V-fold PLP-dependent enzyme [Fuerstiella sp.]|nr:aminotransferase class V-fold PLP-dependent enzyme [Fuerstiella sp.]
MGIPSDFHQHLTQPISNLEELRELMPVVNQPGLYLDHAAAGILPRPTIDAMSSRIQSAGTHGIRHWNLWQKTVQRTRRLVADLIGGHEDEIAFVANTATAAGTVAEGFCWQDGDNVVLSAGEFPSNRFPWQNLERRGVEVRQVNTPDDPEQFVSALDEACDSNTRIVTSSWVDYSTGVRRDPAKLAKVAHHHGALLVLDAIQGLGVFPLNVDSDNIDILIADSRKWLLGPDGAGILAIRRNQQNLFEITRPGWASTSDPLQFEATDLTLSNTATRFESGMHNTFGLTGLHASLRLLKEIPAASRAEHLLTVRSQFKDAICSAGLKFADWPRHAQSGILTIIHPQLETNVLIRQLRRHNITVSLKNDHVRISPHLYNNSNDADLLADALSDTKK